MVWPDEGEHWRTPHSIFVGCGVAIFSTIEENVDADAQVAGDLILEDTAKGRIRFGPVVPDRHLRDLWLVIRTGVPQA